MNNNLKKNYETERLILREWTGPDSEPFINLNKNPVVMEYFPYLYTDDETISSINKFIQHYEIHGYTIFVCELKNTAEFIGFVGLLNRDDMPFSPCVEIGWRLANSYWGNGYATEAAIKCLDIGFNEFKLNEIVSFTSKLNRKSERVMQKIGMEYGNDFNHPKLGNEHPLCLHVLYRLSFEKYILSNR